MNKLLKGKIAIITGANQGLGLAIATNYVAEGASVVLCARNSILLNEAKEQIAKKIQTHDGQFIEAIVADVSNPDDVLKVVTRTLDRGNGIDILVNNAGIYGPMGSIEIGKIGSRPCK